MSVSLFIAIITKAKFFFAMFAFIVSTGILFAKKFEDNPILKGIISLIATLSTYFLADQMYGIYKAEISKSPSVVEQKSTYINSNTKEKWNPKIYKGEGSYSVNSAHTVKDNYTGLIWQKEDDGTKRTWDEAVSYCDALPLAGLKWRLPEQEELYYLGDITKYDPAIDTKYFNVRSSTYWSNTFYEDDSSRAWGVYFRNGDDYWSGKTSTDYVLCVSGQ